MRSYKTDQESTESHNLVWLVERFCHATHSSASPILALAFLDRREYKDRDVSIDVKTSCLRLPYHHGKPGSQKPAMKIKFLSLSYLRQIICKTVTQYIAKLLDLVVGINWSSEFILLLSGARPGHSRASIFVVPFNKQIKLAPLQTVLNTHSQPSDWLTLISAY